jgi:hypothetical protein
MIKKSSWFKFCRKVHKWAGLLLALQVLAWIAGGVVMTAIPKDWVHGLPMIDQAVKDSSAQPLASTAYQYPTSQLLTKLPRDVQVKSIEYTQFLTQAAYQVKTSQGDWWFDGRSGEPIDDISEQQVRQLLASLYVGSGELISLKKLAQGPQEIQYRKNLWQANYNDWIDTSLYLSAFDGRLIRVRSDIWRFYDFFWMLHIMDYSEREDSHNPLVIGFSVASLIFTLSGIVLLFQVFKRRDFRFSRSKSLVKAK